MSSAVTGLNVPAPTASVRSAISTPRARGPSKDLLGEVESGGRRGDRERLAREDGLVGLAVLRAVGRPAPAGCREAAGRGRSARAGPRRLSRSNIDPRRAVVSTFATRASRPSSNRIVRPLFARRPGFARACQRGSPLDRAKEEDLDEPVLLVAAVEPRRRTRTSLRTSRSPAGADPEARRSGGARSPPSSRSSTSSRLVPRGRGCLRDAVRRQVVVEEVDAHAR